MILEGKYIDIHETNALEPYDLGIDDISYIDESWGKRQSKLKYTMKYERNLIESNVYSNKLEDS